MDRDVAEGALGWHAAGRRVASAVVIETWGSSPCAPGSRLVASEAGDFAGAISGGCVEGAVAEATAAVARGAAPVRLRFGVSDACAEGVGLPCGGELEVLVHAIDEVILRAFADPPEPPQVLVTELATGVAVLADPSTEAHHEAIRRERAVLDGERVIEPVQRPVRLVIVGAGRIAEALAGIAEVLGLAVAVVDPRRAFATKERYPSNATVTVGWPDEAMPALDRRTAVVTLSHDPKIDEPALARALASDAFYVGALGSRRTHAARLERLAARGLDEAQRARIHAPVGLDLGGRAPAEIALSIAAQLVQARAS